jgi:molybdopterin-guanine dinucleotide biosynthesis protein A
VSDDTSRARNVDALPGALRTHGAIPAGGAGRRLGQSLPKALAVLEGRTLIERAIATLKELCDSIAVSMSPRRPLPAAAHAGADAAFDFAEGGGALMGLLAAADADRWPAARTLVMGVDYPLARPAALRALIERLDQRAAVVPAPGGRLQPMLAVYSRAGLRALRETFDHGERSTVAAVTALDPIVIEDHELARFPGGSENWMNVNTPEEFAEAARLLRSREARSAV